jgi:hypothetical protein
LNAADGKEMLGMVFHFLFQVILPFTQ